MMLTKNKAVVSVSATDHTMTVKELMSVLRKANPNDVVVIRSTDREPYGWYEITDAAGVEDTIKGWHWTNLWLDAAYHERQ